jgi:two-component system cell cycle sensor histidine kinase/response regulator CckA
VTDTALHVLLVDDQEEQFRFLLKASNAVRHGRIHLEWMADYAEALEAMRREAFDAYLVDYRLGERNGLELLREAVTAGCQAPIILVSGAADESLDVAAMNAGAADYMDKSDITGPLLVRVIRHALDRAATLRQLRDRESALLSSEEQLRLLLDSTGEGIYCLDVQGICTFANPAAVRLLGYTVPNELLGKAMHALAHHTRADGLPYPSDECRIYQAYRHGYGTHVDDEVLWRADGTSLPVEYWSQPIRKDGAVVGAVVTFLDITERRRAEAALESSEARFRTLSEASFDGIAITEDGVLRDVNRGCADMLGYTVDEMIGRPITDFVAESSLDEVRRRVTRQMDGTYEMVAKRKGGQTILVEATTSHQLSEGRTRRISALRDITGKRGFESQLRQSQKMEAVGRLAGGVAHDFNNLLLVIMSYADFLLEGSGPGDPRSDDLRQIMKASDTAASLTRQLLAFSRQQVIRPKPVALGELVKGAAKLLKRVIPEDIELALVADEPLVVRIDPGQLEQVIMNLAVNARDAMPTGGKLTIETSVAELNEEYARAHWPAVPGRFAMLAVSDTGLGMDEATREKIFEPFFTTKPVGKGTGLGLATVYGIIKQNGGFISVYSELRVGTQFKIYLPLEDQAATADEVPVVSEALRGSETVLLVEDAPAVREVARRILERYGYRVVEAATGEAALRLAADLPGQVDLLLSDVVMPGMGGRSLADRLTSLNPAVKVLFMSGYTDDAAVRLDVLGAAATYLQKPFSPVTLARTVREVLDA